MLNKKATIGLLTGMIILGCVPAAYGEDLFAQAQEEAQKMFDDAYAQAQSEFNDAYNQAQDEMNSQIKEALGNSAGDSDAPITSKIKNYVGRNAATVGYYSLGGDLLDDDYGDTLDTIELVLVSEDGAYIDIENDDDLKQYVVVDQSIEADSDITFTYGESGFCDHQTYSEIVLLCKKVNEEPANPIITELTKINPSPDKSTTYIKDYVGRNLATVGYKGLDDNLHDEYNSTFNTVDLVIITEDGSYIEPDDIETMKQYVVTSQNPEANFEEKFNYNDYGFVDTSTYGEIEIHVSKLQ